MLRLYKCKYSGYKWLFLQCFVSIQDSKLLFSRRLIRTLLYYVKSAKKNAGQFWLLLCILSSYLVINTPLPHYRFCDFGKLFWS